MVKLYHTRFYIDIKWMLTFIQNLYKIHITIKCKKRIEHFNKCALYTEYLFKIMMFLYISGVFIQFPYPAYMYFLKNEVVTLIPIYSPLIDEKTPTGYIILGMVHMSWILTATLGILACDFCITLLTVSPLIFSKLILFDLQQLNHDLQINRINIFIKYQLQNIFLMHQQKFE